MSKKKYDLEERLLEYSVRIIKIVEKLRFSLRVLKRLKRNRNNDSRFDIGCFKIHKIKLGAERHHYSMFNVGRFPRDSMFTLFDIRCSSFYWFNLEPSKSCFCLYFFVWVGRWKLDVRCWTFIPQNNPYCINATCEYLQNNLALMRDRT